MFKKITAIATLIISIVVIALGVSLIGNDSSYSVKKTSYTYDAKYYDAEYAAFGADFYTYMYEASDIIVSELNDISHAVSTIVQAQNSLNSAIAESVDAANDIISSLCRVGGMIVIAIGLAILAFAFNALAGAFEKKPAASAGYVPYASTQYSALARQAQPAYNTDNKN